MLTKLGSHTVPSDDLDMAMMPDRRDFLVTYLVMNNEDGKRAGVIADIAIKDVMVNN